MAAGQKETAIASLLQKHADDPVVMDAALSGARGSEPAHSGEAPADGRGATVAHDTAIVMVSATIFAPVRTRPSRRRWRWSPMRRVRHGSGRRCSAARKWRSCRTRRCREPRGVVPHRRSRRPPRPLRVRPARRVPAAVRVREVLMRSTTSANRRSATSAISGGTWSRAWRPWRRRGPRSRRAGCKSFASRRHLRLSRAALGQTCASRGQRAGQDRVAEQYAYEATGK